MKLIEAQVESYELTLAALLVAAEKIAVAATDVGLEPLTLLRAMAHQESSCGLNISRHKLRCGIIQISTRHEANYGYGGHYYSETLSGRWGIAAESSWGALQQMYPNAVRFGFPFAQDPNDPECGLANTSVSIDAAIPMLVRELERVKRFGLNNERHNLDEVADAWNSGSFRDRFIPKRYISEMRGNYEAHKNMAMCPDYKDITRR